MAKLTGTVRFRGKLGEFVGKRRNGKDIISLPGGFTSERLHKEKDTTYKNTWDQAYQFGRASVFARSIYYAFLEGTSPFHQSKDACARLTGLLNRLNQLDFESEPGQKKPTEDALLNLRRFVFNPAALSRWKSEPRIIAREKNKVTFQIDHPDTSIKWPFQAATLHIMLTTLKINVPERTVDNVLNYTVDIERDFFSEPVTFDMPIFDSNNLIGIGLQFGLGGAEKSLPLFNKKYNPLHIIEYIK
jgi:hypothetical protein